MRKKTENGEGKKKLGRDINDPKLMSWNYNFRMSIELARRFEKHCEQHCLSRRKIIEKLIGEWLEKGEGKEEEE